MQLIEGDHLLAGRRPHQTVKEQDEYEEYGFIVDDVEEEEEEGGEDRVDSDEERQKKKKRKKRESGKNYILDEDDYDLLQESNISVSRPKLESKKFKRLKKAQRDAEEEPNGLSDEGELDGSGKAGPTDEEKLKRSLFGDDDGQSLEDIAEQDEQLEEEDVDIDDEEDDMRDFIVEEEDVDERGAPVRRKNVKKRRQRPGISSSALQEAHLIFGDVDDLLRVHKMKSSDMFGETDERSIEDQFDPSILSKEYMTEADDRIREVDIPERMQISEESIGSPPADEVSIKMETEWVYNHLVSGTVHMFNKNGAEEDDDELKRHIARFLELVHSKKFRSPFASDCRVSSRVFDFLLSDYCLLFLWCLI
ncbi:hypothetical protein OROMI_006165 [Orobanche minor]